ncbi:MAG: hypothetical protein KAH44_11840, partial [Oricola sp.]|nr:hypothetical protein [Oricola sp.]
GRRKPLTLNALRDHILRQQPEAVLNLLHEIEQFAGIRVEFWLYPEDSIPDGSNPFAATLQVHRDAADILVRDPDRTTSQQVLHELLHLQRYWMEGVPQVVPVGTDPGNWDITSQIENVLEHLVIIPRERERGIDSFPYWRENLCGFWKSYPWPNLQNDFARRKNALLSWLQLEDLEPSIELRTIAENALRSEGLLTEAKRLRSRIKLKIRDKPQMIAHALQASRIPRNNVRLLYFDVKARSEQRETVPKTR